MSDIFSIFNTARKGLNVHQGAISTTSNNIANANTPGYSRQVTVIQEALQIGKFGTGADLNYVQRARDEFLDRQIRSELGVLEKNKAMAAFLSDVETVIMEPSDSGISSRLTAFFDGWQELSVNPENSNTRTLVVQNAKMLADSLNHYISQLSSFRDQAGQLMESRVREVNAYLQQIRDANAQISMMKMRGEEPNALLDSRDVALDELSKIFDFTVAADSTKKGGVKVMAGVSDPVKLDVLEENLRLATFADAADNGDGTYSITLGDGTVIEVSNADYDAAVKGQQLFWYRDNGDGTYTVKNFSSENGVLEGYLESIQAMDKFEMQLDSLAKTLTLTVNTIMNDGLPTNDPDYIEFFTLDSTSFPEDTEIRARNIAVNNDLIEDVSLIRTSKNEGDTGDGSRALAIAQLRDAKFNLDRFLSGFDPDDATNDTNTYYYDPATMKFNIDQSGSTFNLYLQDVVETMGIQSKGAKTLAANQEALVQQLQLRQQSVSGVSIDEEISNLIQYQRAYEANAKVLSALDEMLQVLLNQIGL